MTDYKHTLNLPKTNFPMRANLPRREPEVLERWERTGLVAQLRKARRGAPKYVLHDGPLRQWRHSPWARGQQGAQGYGGEGALA